MVAFQNHPDEWSRLDFTTLRDGYALMYWKTEILEKDLKWFEEFTWAAREALDWLEEQIDEENAE